MARIFELAVQTDVERDVATRRAEHGDNALDHPLLRDAEQRKPVGAREPEWAEPPFQATAA